MRLQYELKPLNYFQVEIFGIDNSPECEYSDVLYAGGVWTRGTTVADFEGILRIAGPANKMQKLKTEGFFAYMGR